jgi:NAD(P)-dependent dehydrogenase (short-subunit alcohol dehydrogenase family)
VDPLTLYVLFFFKCQHQKRGKTKCTKTNKVLPLYIYTQLINNAGYFKEEVERLDSLDFPDQLKTIDICACGPLRVTASLINGGLLKEGSKVIMITSQGGSISWRTVQNPTGGDYGHHVRYWRWGCQGGENGAQPV